MLFEMKWKEMEKSSKKEERETMHNQSSGGSFYVLRWSQKWAGGKETGTIIIICVLQFMEAFRYQCNCIASISGSNNQISIKHIDLGKSIIIRTLSNKLLSLAAQVRKFT